MFVAFVCCICLTMRIVEEALAHCGARRVYILPSPPHCLRPLSYAANAIFFFLSFFFFTKNQSFSNSKLLLYSLFFRWTSLCGSSAFIITFMFRIYCWTIALFNVARSLLFLYLIEMCDSMTIIFMSTNISSQCCIITINLLNWITTVLA